MDDFEFYNDWPEHMAKMDPYEKRARKASELAFQQWLQGLSDNNIEFVDGFVAGAHWAKSDFLSTQPAPRGDWTDDIVRQSLEQLQK